MKNENIIHELGRIVVGGFYDYQEIRKTNMNRMRDIIRKRNEGISFDAVEEKKEDKEKSFGKEYNDRNLSKLLDKMYDEGKFTDEEKDYINRVLDANSKAVKMESAYKVMMDEYLKSEPLWWRWIENIRGISTILGANLIKNFGYCERFEYISSLWKYCGLHVVDGKAPKRTKGVKIDYNPAMRTLCWKIGDSFIKMRTIPYRGIYDGEKARQLKLMENGTDNAPKSKLHADLRSRRKMVKIFLSHYWQVGRTLKGLQLTRPYSEEKMGHRHMIPPPAFKELVEDVGGTSG